MFIFSERGAEAAPFLLSPTEKGNTMPTRVSLVSRSLLDLPSQRAQQENEALKPDQTNTVQSERGQECGTQEAALRALEVLSHPLPIAVLLGLALLIWGW